MHSKNDEWSWIENITKFEILDSYVGDFDKRDFGFIDVSQISSGIRTSLING